MGQWPVSGNPSMKSRFSLAAVLVVVVVVSCLLPALLLLDDEIIRGTRSAARVSSQSSLPYRMTMEMDDDNKVAMRDCNGW